MRIYDNRFKDMAEVRDVDTGVLLGFAPHVSTSHHVLEVNLYPHPRAGFSADAPCDSMVAVKYETVRFQIESVYLPIGGGQPKAVRYYAITRRDWEKLLRDLEHW